jgi:glycosyltransferase involved in cell wall biosynthesis
MTAAPLFSVLIPARNEAQFLGACLDALDCAAAYLKTRDETASLTDPLLEIIVITNRCTDETEAIALSRGCAVVRDDSKNLARIRNAGARAASGEIIVTVDADSVVSENLLFEVLSRLRSGSVVGGGVRIMPERWSVGIFLTALCLVPVLLWHRISGGVFFCYRKDFDAIGGFNEKLASVEDLDFAKRLSRYGNGRGLKFVNLWRAYIRTSCRKFDRLGDWYFLLHPLKFATLLRGHNQAEADKVWYDFER